jgi:hypothetical protein
MLTLTSRSPKGSVFWMLFASLSKDGKKFNLEMLGIQRVNPSPKTWQKGLTKAALSFR